jgi:acetolactate synthase-1/2/3 large subunit
VLVIGTRANFIVGHFLPPRFAADAKFIQVNIDEAEIGNNRHADLGIVGDARAVLQQLMEEARQDLANKQIAVWIERLRTKAEERNEKVLPLLHSDKKPIHPLRLCQELRDFMPRDAILVVDGHEILSFARQSIPTYYPGHRLNIGPSGCIGVGVPFGIGAKIAKPDKAVFVLSGDGAFGFNGMEMDTAVRHNLPMVVIISNNGGWTNALTSDWVTGRDLAFTRYDKIAEAMGGHGEFVEEPGEIRPALERAFDSGKPSLVNVMTDPYAMSITQKFGGEQWS